MTARKVKPWHFFIVFLILTSAIIAYFSKVMFTNIINSHAIDQSLHVQPSHKLKSIILAAFLTSKKDPQRNKFMPPTFSYMRNFYNTVIFHNLTAIIFHDKLGEEFVSKYTTTNVKFEKVDIINDLSVNDFRFVYKFRFLKMNEYDYVLFVDIADTFFWHDPFVYMKNNSQHSLFLSLDRGTPGSTKWINNKMRFCYGINPKYDKTPYVNVGLWGGKYKEVLCILECIVNHLYQTAIPEKTCDMAAMNWCVKYERCAPRHEVFISTQFANHPFNQYCDDKNRIIIIDKCPDSPEQCVSIQDGQLVRSNCRKDN